MEKTERWTMDEKALSIAKYSNIDKYGNKRNAVKLAIIWKAKVLQNYKYVIMEMDVMDGRVFSITYDGNRQIWYLDQYERHGHLKYMDITVEAEIMRKVEE